MNIVHILVDYDNLRLSDVSEIKSVIDQVICCLYAGENIQENDKTEIDVRLYGGWDELNNDDFSNSASRLAQDLTVFLEGNYPQRNLMPNNRIQISLIHSLAIMPTKFLPFTYRTRQALNRIHVCKPDNECCEKSKQHLDFFRSVKKHQTCPYCGRESSINFWISEQKLVDTMLAMDLSFYANHDPTALLVIISDDDDFIPVIFQQICSGKKIFHVQKKPGVCYERYKEIAFTKYYQNIKL